jgi:hypothetical protein
MITQTKENICTTPTPLEQEASLLYNLCSNLQFYCPRWLKYVLFYLANSFIHIFFYSGTELQVGNCSRVDTKFCSTNNFCISRNLLFHEISAKFRETKRKVLQNLEN